MYIHYSTSLQVGVDERYSFPIIIIDKRIRAICYPRSRMAQSFILPQSSLWSNLQFWARAEVMEDL